jgi:membrane protease YdiL (CAAX protease family)
MSLGCMAMQLAVSDPFEDAIRGHVPTMSLDASFDVLQAVLAVYGILFIAGLVALVWVVSRHVREPQLWQSRASQIHRRPWAWRDASLILLVVLFLHAGIALVHQAVRLFGVGVDESVQWIWMLAHTVALHGGIVGGIVWRLRARQLTWRQAFLRRHRSLSAEVLSGFMSYLAVLPLLLLFSAAYQVWLRLNGLDASPQDLVLFFVDLEEGWFLYYMVTLAVVVAPISEELLFRGVLLPLMVRRLGLGTGIALNAGLFALMHFHAAALVPLFVFAVALCLAGIYSQSVRVPIVMHMCFNGLSLVVMRALGG